MKTPSFEKQVLPSPFRKFMLSFWVQPSIGLLPSILGVCCLVGEIAAAIGFLGAIAMIPFSESRVASGRESLRINVPHETFDAGCNVQFGSGSLSTSADNPTRATDKGLGGFSLGPLRLRAETYANGANIHGVSVQKIEGTVTILEAPDAARALAYVRWPFLLSLLCAGVTTVVLLDLLRRMLGSVAKNEVFTAANIRNVYSIGILFIVSSVAKILLAGWLVGRFLSFVSLNLPQGKGILESSFEGNGSGMGIGLVVIVLAEIFRQGLALKEDSQLTI